MPATYTHYRFGKDVLQALHKEEVKRIIKENERIFNVGLHGPDIFFYYHLFYRNDVQRKGSVLHNECAKPFFEEAKQYAQQDAYIAYYLGFLCHYILDSQCHTYIDYYERMNHVAHNAIENSFDQYLLIKDGLNHMAYQTACHVVANEEDAKIIATITKDEPRVIYHCVKSLIRVQGWLRPNYVKKAILRSLAFISRQQKIAGIMMERLPSKESKKSDIVLYEIYLRSVMQADMMIDNFYEYIMGREDLSSLFRHNYASVK